MADPTAPRRIRVERGIYRRSTGVLEVGYKDEIGRLRWRTVEGGILAARKVRDDINARRARGESVGPKPKLRFEEAADAWLDGPVSTFVRQRRRSTDAWSTSTFVRALPGDDSTR